MSQVLPVKISALLEFCHDSSQRHNFVTTSVVECVLAINHLHMFSKREKQWDPRAVVNNDIISIAYLLTNIPGSGLKFPCLSEFSFACDFKIS